MARSGTGKYPTVLMKPEAKSIARTKPGIYKKSGRNGSWGQSQESSHNILHQGLYMA